MGQGLKKQQEAQKSQTISTTMFYHQGLFFLAEIFSNLQWVLHIGQLQF